MYFKLSEKAAHKSIDNTISSSRYNIFADFTVPLILILPCQQPEYVQSIAIEILS